jgi:hypothetical protein
MQQQLRSPLAPLKKGGTRSLDTLYIPFTSRAKREPEIKSSYSGWFNGNLGGRLICSFSEIGIRKKLIYQTNWRN